VLRQSTILFAVLIVVVGVATAYYVAIHPDTAIIPLVLGILGFTFGSLLGIFLLGIFTKKRGNDFGNVIAMSLAVITVLILSSDFLQRSMGIQNPFVIAFPWRITLGTFVTFFVGLCFRTDPEKVIEREKADATNA
jgi:Na+/proline symporter